MSLLEQDQQNSVQITGESRKESLKTQRQARHAWYAYFAAYEPVSILVMQLLFPLLINSLSVAASTISTDSVSRPCTSSDNLSMCRLPGLKCSPTTFTYFTMAVSVMMQTVAFVSLGGLADYGQWRGRILGGSGVVGGVVGTVTLLVCLMATRWPTWTMSSLIVNSVLFIVLQVVFGTASICYNAVLPLLSRPHDGEGKEGDDNGMNEISLRGMMAGYSASLVELAVAAAGLSLIKTEGRPWITAIPITASTLGWAVIGALAIRRMTPLHCPGLPLPPNQSLVSFSWHMAWSTCKSLGKLRTLRTYLLCYLLFSDGYGTVGLVAVLFASTEMHLSEWMIVVAVGCLLVSCIFGSWFYIKVDGGKRFSTIGMLIGLCLLQSLIPLYGMLGLISDLPIGFKKPWEAYALAVYYGFHIGACNSYARVAFAELLPPGREAEYFSLFAITDKGSSIVGPLVFGVVTAMAVDKRWGLIFLLVMLVAPLPVLWRLDMAAGQREARELVNH